MMKPEKSKVPPNLTITHTTEKMKSKLPSKTEKETPKNTEDEKPDNINIMSLYQLIKEVSIGQIESKKASEENTRLLKENHENIAKINALDLGRVIKKSGRKC